MEFFRIRRDIPFMRHALVLNAISFLTFAAAVFFLFTRGLHLSIEFTGGTVVEVEYAQTADINRTRGLVESLGYGEVQVQNFGTSHDVMIRLPVRAGIKQTDQASRVFEVLCKAEQGTVSHQAVHHATGRTGQPAFLRGGRGRRAAEAVAHRGGRPVGRRRAEVATRTWACSPWVSPSWASCCTWLSASSGSSRSPASSPTCTTWSSSWASSPSSSGSSRWRCWRRCWRCWGTR